ncbi:MAG: hypothetical protein M1840_002482 [Geoglossum simile]|nr:MAG: hypothetical protein M1840_002482 [Geoglossum simile]
MADINPDYPWRLRPYARTSGTPGKSYRWRDRRPPPLDLSHHVSYRRLRPTKEVSRAKDKECRNMTEWVRKVLGLYREISTTLSPNLPTQEPSEGSPGQNIRDAPSAELVWSSTIYAEPFGHAHRGLEEDSPGQEHRRISPLPHSPVCEPADFNPEARDPRWGDLGFTAPRMPGSFPGDFAEGDYWESATPRTLGSPVRDFAQDYYSEHTAPRIPGSFPGDFAQESDEYREYCGLDDPRNAAWYRPDIGGLRAIASHPVTDESREPRNSPRTEGAGQGRTEVE